MGIGLDKKQIRRSCLMSDRPKPQPMELFRHFKGNTYQVLCTARHSETGEEMVVYQALYGDYGVYVRPLDMFMEPVDRTKYPDAGQHYRFERITVSREAADSVSNTADTSIVGCEAPDKGSNTADSSAVSHEAPDGRITPDSGLPAADAPIGGSEGSDAGFNLDPDVERFLDADTYEERVEILTEMEQKIDDDMINIMSTTVGIEVLEGPVRKRFDRFKDALMLRRHYEAHRLR